MSLSSSAFILAMGPPQPGQPAWVSMVPLVLMMVIFYFILIRPQQKKAKEHAEMLKGLRPGDKVIISGGIVGVVLTVKEKTASVRSAEAKFEVLKSAVTEVTERGSSSSEA